MKPSRMRAWCDDPECAACDDLSEFDTILTDGSADVLTQQWLAADTIYIDEYGNPLEYKETTE